MSRVFSRFIRASTNTAIFVLATASVARLRRKIILQACIMFTRRDEKIKVKRTDEKDASTQLVKVSLLVHLTLLYVRKDVS